MHTDIPYLKYPYELTFSGNYVYNLTFEDKFFYAHSHIKELDIYFNNNKFENFNAKEA